MTTETNAFNGPNSLKNYRTHKLTHQLTNIKKNTLSLLWRGLHLHGYTHYKTREKKKKESIGCHCFYALQWLPFFQKRTTPNRQRLLLSWVLEGASLFWHRKCLFSSLCQRPSYHIHMLRRGTLGERGIWLLVTNFLEWHLWQRGFFLLIVLLALQKMALSRVP